MIKCSFGGVSLPICKVCKANNHSFTKICKKCGQALIIEEGQQCQSCNHINGPFAKNCRSCNRPLKDEKSSTVLSKTTDDQNSKLTLFQNALEKSYLYKDDLFAGLPYRTTIKGELIHFHLGDITYEFRDIKELKEIFNLNNNEIPILIKKNIVKLFKPMMDKYVSNKRLVLLDTNLGHDEFLMTFSNENGQLAGTFYLPVFENQILSYLDLVLETCEISNTYLDMFEIETNNPKIDDDTQIYNDIFNKLLKETFDYHNYKYKLIESNTKSRTYRIGNKLIQIDADIRKKILIYTYLNQSLEIHEDESLFTSILLTNWIINSKNNTYTIDERMKRYSIQNLHLEINFDNEQEIYCSNKIIGLSFTVVSLNTIVINFPHIKLFAVEPIYPNMDNGEFELLINRYISFSNNSSVIHKIRMIEDSTEKRISIKTLIDSGCVLDIYSNNSLLTSIVISSETSDEDIYKCIEKINFLEQIVH